MLNLNGTITLNASSSLFVLPTAANPVTINGGTIAFAGGTGQRQLLDFGGSGTLTLGPTTTVHGGGSGGPYNGSSIGHSSPNPFTLVNQGLISADQANKFLTIETKYLTNQGTMQATNGAYLYITPETTWSNAGLIRSSPGSNVILSGLVSTPGLGTIAANGGDVTIGGTLDNTGSTLTLDHNTGSWQLSLGSLANGMIKHGSVNLLDGTQLKFNNGIGFLDDVTVNGDLGFLDYGRLEVLNQLVLNGTAHLSGSNSLIGFSGNQTLASGTISFEGATGGVRTLEADNGSSLTLGPAATIHGGHGQIFTGATSTVLNQGLISSDVAGQDISIYSGRFTNSGTVQAINGGTITYIPPMAPGQLPVFINDHVLRVGSGSAFVWNGPFVQTSQGVLSVELNASESAGAGTIALLSDVELDGLLRLTLAPGFEPALGQRFSILSFPAGRPNGAFRLFELPTLASGFTWDTTQIYQSGTIGVVPSPGGVAVLGLILILPRRRRGGRS
jgi:hypothetical protein